MPPGLHSSASYKPGIAFRSPSDIERGHFPDRPMLLCRAELQRELDITRGLETFLIALPLLTSLECRTGCQPVRALLGSSEQARSLFYIKRP